MSISPFSFTFVPFSVFTFYHTPSASLVPLSQGDKEGL